MIESVVNNAGELLQTASYIVAAAALIAAMTKNESDNRWVARTRKVLDILALNIGNAKNEKSNK